MKVKIHVYMYRQLLASHKVKHQSEEVQVYGICICMLNLSVLSVLIIGVMRLFYNERAMSEGRFWHVMFQSVFLRTTYSSRYVYFR